MIDSSYFVTNVLVPFSVALAGSTGSEIFRPVFRVLDNWFYLSFGSKSDFEVKKKKLLEESELSIYNAELEKVNYVGMFKKEVIDELSIIHESDLSVPDKHILAEVMSNLSNYLDVVETRKLLAKIIAASCDVQRKSAIHPTDVDTIRKLVTEDIDLMYTLYFSLGTGLIITPKAYTLLENEGDPCPIGISRKTIRSHFIYTNHVDGDEYSLLNGPYHVDADTILDSDSIPDKSIEVLERMGIVESMAFKEFSHPTIIDIHDFVHTSIAKVLELDEVKKYEYQLKEGFEKVFLMGETKIIQLTSFGEKICKILFNDKCVPFIDISDADDFEIAIDVEDM